MSSKFLAQIAHEREMQDSKWGEQNHPNWTLTASRVDLEEYTQGSAGAHFKSIVDIKAQNFDLFPVSYFDILMEEVAEAHDEAKAGNIKALKEELVQVAAVAVAWLEKIERDEEKTSG